MCLLTHTQSDSHNHSSRNPKISKEKHQINATKRLCEDEAMMTMMITMMTTMTMVIILEQYFRIIFCSFKQKHVCGKVALLVCYVVLAVCASAIANVYSAMKDFPPVVVAFCSEYFFFHVGNFFCTFIAFCKLSPLTMANTHAPGPN